jgi:hypothetical protein
MLNLLKTETDQRAVETYFATVVSSFGRRSSIKLRQHTMSDLVHDVTLYSKKKFKYRQAIVISVVLTRKSGFSPRRFCTMSVLMLPGGIHALAKKKWSAFVFTRIDSC